MHTLTVCGVDLTRDDLPGALRAAADGAPRRAYHALDLSGVAWLHELWSAANTSLRAAIPLALRPLLSSPDPAHRSFAAHALDLASEYIADDDLPSIRALLDAADLDPSARRALASLLNKLVLARRLPVDDAVRAAALDPLTDAALLAACWLHDHTWAAANLHAILPQDPADAARCLTSALHALRDSEWRLTEATVDARRDTLGEARADAIRSRMARVAATIDWSLYERLGAPRWT
jgi:hypothetical protein